MTAPERELRKQMESHYGQLAARHRESAAAHEHLVDLLHAVRPQTVF
jgi:serine/threonine-protein kinase PknG